MTISKQRQEDNARGREIKAVQDAWVVYRVDKAKAKSQAAGKKAVSKREKAVRVARDTFLKTYKRIYPGVLR